MSLKKSAVVLLSAGLDSSYNLYRYARELTVRLALTFDYGQRAAAREIERSAELCAALDVPHRVIDLRWFADFTKTSLVNSSASNSPASASSAAGAPPVPVGDDVVIESLERSKASAARVWVPNRNGIFLNIAAGFAEGLGADFVVPGFNREEAATFPDNSGAFLGALDACWSLSTATGVTTRCFSTDLDKTEIVRQGARLGLPFARLWPCYLSEAAWCGACESCARYRRALAANGLDFDYLNSGDNPRAD